MTNTMESSMAVRHARPAAAREGGAVARCERLHATSSLGLRRAHCLSAQFPYLSCQCCVDSCPAKVLHRTDHQLQLDAGCLNCGRCAAVCPTGALSLPGLNAALAPGTSDRTLYVDCWKVPRSESPADAVRVPCVGAVSVGQWLALAAGGRVVMALDRGWCERCSAGGSIHPAQASLTEARVLLSETGVSQEAMPRLMRRLLPAWRMPRAIPAARAERHINRRRFFAGLAGELAEAATAYRGASDSGPTPTPTRATRPGQVRALERERRLAALALLARRRGTRLSPRLFPQIEISARCCDHHVCASLCPTGALAVYEDGGVSGVRFDAFACMACGACERACPEQALRLLAEGHGAVPTAAVVLTRHERRECYDCGASFSAVAEEPYCPSCRKSRGAFAMFFDARADGARAPPT
jgi:ferredoxin